MAAKTRLEFCALNDHRCMAHYSCALCEDLWEAATEAAKEKVTSTNSAMVPCPTCGAACSIGGDDEEETHYYIPVVPFGAQGQ